MRFLICIVRLLLVRLRLDVHSFFQMRVLSYNEGMLPETSNIKIIDHLTKWALALSGSFLSRSDNVLFFSFLDLLFFMS